jgi:hypothetical protein
LIAPCDKCRYLVTVTGGFAWGSGSLGYLYEHGWNGIGVTKDKDNNNTLSYSKVDKGLYLLYKNERIVSHSIRIVLWI